MQGFFVLAGELLPHENHLGPFLLKGQAEEEGTAPRPAREAAERWQEEGVRFSPAPLLLPKEEPDRGLRQGHLMIALTVRAAKRGGRKEGSHD